MTRQREKTSNGVPGVWFRQAYPNGHSAWFPQRAPSGNFLADKMATHRGWNVGHRGFFVQRPRGPWDLDPVTPPFICIYICACTYTCTCACTGTSHAHTHKDYTRMCVCVYVCVHIYIYACMRIHVNTHVYTCICICRGVCICICICICLRMHAYIYGDVYMHLCTEVRRSVRCTCE